jgi:hypothetical protein
MRLVANFGALLGTAALAAACAGHASGAARADRCPLHDQDSVYASSTGPVYRDCAVDRRATLTNTDVHPQGAVAPGAPGPDRCYSVEMEFVVDAHGRPEVNTARIIRTNDQSFADAWLKTLPAFRYEPAMRNGVPVRQIVDERRTAATKTVVVRAGSMPPPPGSVGNSMPMC